MDKTKPTTAEIKYQDEFNGVLYQVLKKKNQEYEVWRKPRKGKPRAILNPASNRPEFADFGVACYELFRDVYIGQLNRQQQKLNHS